MKSTKVLAMFALLFVLAMTVAAGGDPSEAESAQATDYKPHDDLLMDISRQVPEFGGMFLSEDNTVLFVYVTDDSQDAPSTGAVRRAIEDVLKDSPTEGRELRLVPGKFSIPKLHEWYGEMQTTVFANPHVVLTDLDEGLNRIEIGVDSLDVADQLRPSLASLGIPNEALIISLRARPVPATHTLRGRASGDKMEGGYQIKGKGLGNCTLGFNTVRAGEAGLVTAGHCTESGQWDGGVDGTKFYQPSSAVNATPIGKETIDPSFSSDPPQCETGKVCRYSDAAFVRFASGVSYNLGKIAKTTSRGSINVDHNAKFRIVRERTTTSIGETIDKIGRTTGWTSGDVTDTCVHTSLPNNRVLLCQTIAHVDADLGDSGAPVFAVTDSPNTGDVQLLGITWASNTSVNPTVMWFSPVGNIYLDLGRGDTWNSCDPSIGC